VSWEAARKFILPALKLDKERGEADLMADFARGHAQLWSGHRAAFVTQIDPEEKALHCWLAGGDLTELLAMIPGLEAFGRGWGCTSATVSVEGRQGWIRVLKPHGYERDGDVLRKALADG
jgi:hypothetical protein